MPQGLLPVPYYYPFPLLCPHHTPARLREAFTLRSPHQGACPKWAVVVWSETFCGIWSAVWPCKAGKTVHCALLPLDMRAAAWVKSERHCKCRKLQEEQGEVGRTTTVQVPVSPRPHIHISCPTLGSHAPSGLSLQGKHTGLVWSFSFISQFQVGQFHFKLSLP